MTIKNKKMFIVSAALFLFCFSPVLAYLAIIFSGGNTLLFEDGLLAAFRFILKDLITGWASLIGVTLILGGCQLMFIGLIGQYLARIFEEVKGRPRYIFKQTPADSKPSICDDEGTENVS